MKKKYIVPEAIEKLHLKYLALNELSARYTKIPLGYRRARKASIEAEKVKGKFWKQVAELYPDIKTKDLGYTVTGGLKILLGDNNE